MQAPIDSFLIIGDKYSTQSPIVDDGVKVCSDLKSLDADEDDTGQVDSISWLDYFFDNIFYIQNQLQSRLELEIKSASPSFSDVLRLFVYKDLAAKVDRRYATPSSESCTEIAPSEPHFLYEVTNIISSMQTPDTMIAEKKETTLVIEWTGINDVINASADFSIKDAIAIASARITNIERLIGLGYKNFVLFNLPLLSVLPITNFISADRRDRKHQLSEGINQNLELICSTLRREHPLCNIQIFNIADFFHAFDESASTSLSGMPDFYADRFYHGRLLSSEANKLLAEKFYHDFFKINYVFYPPISILEERFKDAYAKKWAASSKGFRKFFTSSKINPVETNLEGIFRHALLEEGSRTLYVLIELNWLNEDKTLRSSHPLIIDAFLKTNRTLTATGTVVS
jgi:hypothetical protein